MSMMCRPMWPFLLMYVSHDMRHTGFSQVDGGHRTPEKWGVTTKNPDFVVTKPKIKLCGDKPRFCHDKAKDIVLGIQNADVTIQKC